MKDNEHPKQGGVTRRDWLRSAVSLPVLGLLGHEAWKRDKLERQKRERILGALQGESPGAAGGAASTPDPAAAAAADGGTPAGHPAAPATPPAPARRRLTRRHHRDLIRIGIIGCGTRGEQLAHALGFARPEWITSARQAHTANRLDTRLQDFLEQEDLGVAITAVCDVFDQRRARAAETAQAELRPGAAGKGRPPAPSQCRDYHDLLARTDVDAVLIATPDFQHAPIALAAIAAGKHLYCEKCTTRTEEEAHALRAAVHASDLVFQAGHQYPQNANYAKARELIADNLLGKITLIETSSNRNTTSGAWVRHLDSQGRPRPGDPQSIDWKLWLGSAPEVPFSIDRFYNWTKWWDYATGLSGQLYCHEVDIVNQLFHVGIPASVVASGGIYYHKDGREIPDIWNVVCEYPDHDLTHLYSATLANSRQRDRLFMGHDAAMELGETLRLYVDGDSTRYQARIAAGDLSPSQPLLTFQPGLGAFDLVTSASEKFYAGRGLTWTWRNGHRVDTTYLHLREWLDCIRHGGEPSCGIEKAFETTITCHMATRSYREQRRVTWDPQQQRIV